MTTIEAKLFLNQALILTALAYLVPAPLSDLIFKAAEEANAMVEKETKDRE